MPALRDCERHERVQAGGREQQHAAGDCAHGDGAKVVAKACARIRECPDRSHGSTGRDPPRHRAGVRRATGCIAQAGPCRRAAWIDGRCMQVTRVGRYGYFRRHDDFGTQRSLPAVQRCPSSTDQPETVSEALLGAIRVGEVVDDDPASASRRRRRRTATGEARHRIDIEERGIDLVEPGGEVLQRPLITPVARRGPRCRRIPTAPRRRRKGAVTPRMPGSAAVVRANSRCDCRRACGGRRISKMKRLLPVTRAVELLGGEARPTTPSAGCPTRVRRRAAGPPKKAICAITKWSMCAERASSSRARRCEPGPGAVAGARDQAVHGGPGDGEPGDEEEAVVTIRRRSSRTVATGICWRRPAMTTRTRSIKSATPAAATVRMNHCHEELRHDPRAGRRRGRGGRRPAAA